MSALNVRTAVEVAKRYKDSSYESLASKELTEKAVLKGIGKLEAIPTVSIKVALSKKSETAEFCFSRPGTVPSTVLHLSSGRLALKNIKFIVADDDGTVLCEDLLIEHPVLKHLRVGTKTLLETKICSLSEPNCSLPD